MITMITAASKLLSDSYHEECAKGSGCQALRGKPSVPLSAQLYAQATELGCLGIPDQQSLCCQCYSRRHTRLDELELELVLYKTEKQFADGRPMDGSALACLFDQMFIACVSTDQ